MRDPVIDRALRAAGGPTALGRQLGIRMESIYSWRRVPPERVLDVERITGISRHELRPDIFGEPAPCSVPSTGHAA